MATLADVERVVGPGESLRHHAPLRRGGHVGVTDDRVLVVTGGGTTSVRHESIAEVTVQSFDWYLGVLSAGLVGFGVLSFGRSLAGGLAFVAFGAASLYWTYRKRGQVQLHVRHRRKPVSFSMDDADAFRDALGTALDRYESRPASAGVDE